MRKLFLLIAAVSAALAGDAGAQPDRYKFGFGTNRPGSDRILVAVTTEYTEELGHGFEHQGRLDAGADFVSSGPPFRFSARLPEGNYRVTVTLGGATDSQVTVKAEARRLVLERVAVRGGEAVPRTFTVNVRRPELPRGERVRLKRRELETEMVTWDDRLTLEFNGINPAVRTLEIGPTNVPTLFICGDSTVCDQPAEPWNSWGQMLPRFFGPGLAVANYAQSGESIKSSLGAKRFDKVFSRMRTNDWLFVQFGHNDMKDKATNALAVYKNNLKQIVAQTRAKGATPVLVTSMERKAGIARDTLADYPQTVRDVAKEDGVALIDLHAMSRVLYRALGADLDKAFQDGTHHNNYGSYELARCVVEGIRQNKLDLVRYLAEDAGAFDPAHPDAVAAFAMAVSPNASGHKPDGD